MTTLNNGDDDTAAPPPPKKKKKKSVVGVGFAGMIAGGLEIVVTYPLEFAKTAAQLEGRWAVTHTGFQRSTLAYLRSTLETHGVAGIYKGATPWFVFAGPRSAVRFAVFEQCKARTKLNDFACGLVAGSAEAALLQTPNQAIQIKLVHDAANERRYAGASFLRALRLIRDDFGFVDGFFRGITPAVLKGAVTNGIRFFGYNLLLRHGGGARGDGAPPPTYDSMLAGGVAGAASAVVSQPIDTVKANMMGLDRYPSSLHCAAAIVRADGPFALWRGVWPRTSRVFLEVGLQFTLFELIFSTLDSLNLF